MSTSPCASVATTQLYQDMTELFTPIACAPFGVDDSQYCCFLNHMPSTPTVATIAQWAPSDLVPMPKTAFGVQAESSSKSGEDVCYHGTCLAQPNLVGGFGNVTPILQSDATCTSPVLSQVSDSASCAPDWALSAGCDPRTQQGCIPCCTGLVPHQLTCRTVRGRSYALYQCLARPPCVYPNTLVGDQCYYNNYNNPDCSDVLPKPNPTDKPTFFDSCGPKEPMQFAYTQWCWNAFSQVPQGVYYCQGNQDYHTLNSDSCYSPPVSYSGQWVKCETPGGCAQTNAFLTLTGNPNVQPPINASCYCTLPGETAACPIPAQLASSNRMTLAHFQPPATSPWL